MSRDVPVKPPELNQPRLATQTAKVEQMLIVLEVLWLFVTQQQLTDLVLNC